MQFSSSQIAELNLNRPSAALHQDRLVIAITGADHALWQRTYDHGWSEWTSLDGQLSSGCSAVVNAAGRLTMFARGADNALWHRWLDQTWSEWTTLDGILTSAPAAVVTAEGRLTVFARGTDHALWHRWYDNGWSSWASLGGVITSAPAAVVTADGQLTVFARGTDNALWQRTHDGSWSRWTSLGGVLSSAPTATVTAEGRLMVCARGTDNALWQRTHDGSWSSWTSAGGALTSSPCALRDADRRTVIYARGADGAIQYTASGDNDWQTFGPADPQVGVAAGALLDDPQLRAIAERIANKFILAAEKAVAHTMNPQAYPLPSKANTLEHAFAARFQRIPELRRAQVIERMRPLIEAPVDARRERYGDLATVRLDTQVPLETQIAALPIPNELMISAARIQSLVGARSLVRFGGGLVPQDSGTLTLKIHSVRCVDLTNPETGEDSISLGGVLVGPPSTGAGASGAPEITQGTAIEKMRFPRDGYVCPFTPPFVFGEFKIASWGPYVANIFLAEVDNGGFPEWLSMLLDKLKAAGVEIAKYYAGAFSGPFAPITVPIAGAISEWVASQVNRWIEDWWKDDIFPILSLATSLPARPGRQVRSVRGHDGEYAVEYEWGGNTFGPVEITPPSSRSLAPARMDFTLQDEGVFQSVGAEQNEAWATTAWQASGNQARLSLPDQVFRFAPGAEHVPGALEQVSVGGSDQIWGVNKEHQIFCWQGDTFVTVSGQLRQVAVGVDGTVWGITPAGTAVHWVGDTPAPPVIVGWEDGRPVVSRVASQIRSKWEATDFNVKKIAVARANVVWALGGSGIAYRWNGAGFEAQPRSVGLIDISVGADGTVFGVDAQSRLRSWSGVEWTVIDTFPSAIRHVAVADARRVWAISATGSLWRYDNRVR